MEAYWILADKLVGAFISVLLDSEIVDYMYKIHTQKIQHSDIQTLLEL